MNTKGWAKWLLLAVLLASQAILTGQVIDQDVREEAARSERLSVLITLRYQPQREINERVREAASRRMEAAHVNWQRLAGLRNAPEQALRDARAELDTVLVEMRTEAGRQIDAEITPQQDLLEAKLQGLGVRAIRRFRAINMLAADIPATALPALEADPEIASVSLSKKQQSQAINQVNLDAINTSAFWNDTVQAFKKTGESVAVLDSGIDKDHQHFAGIKANIDDSRIYLAGQPANVCVDDRAATDNTLGHGTSVAGIVAGSGSSTTLVDPYKGTVSGVAVGLGTGTSGKLYSLKVACLEQATDIKSTSDPSDTIDALSTALNGKGTVNPLPVRIFNYSYGGSTTTDDDKFSQQIDMLIDSNQPDVSIIVAAGNTGARDKTVESPGIAYNVITVANMDPKGTADRGDDIIWATSSRGPTQNGRKKPDVAAPGTNIPVPEAYTTNYRLDTGTSQAAPHVAGTLALLHQYGVTNTLGAKALLINSSGQDKGTDGKYVGWKKDVGWGYINLQELHAEAHLSQDVTAGSPPCLSTGIGTKGGCFVGTVSSPGYKLFKGKVTSDFKATLVWNRHIQTSATGLTSLLQRLDLILYVKQGDGYVQVSADTSTINNVKQVSTTTPGDYMIKVKAIGSFDTNYSPERFALATSVAFEGAVDDPALMVSCQPPAGIAPNSQFNMPCTVTNSGDVPAEDLKASLTFRQMATGVPPYTVTQTLSLVPAKGSAALNFTATAPVPLPDGDGSYGATVTVTDANGRPSGNGTGGDIWLNDCWKATRLLPASMTVPPSFTQGSFQVDVPAGCVWRVSNYLGGPSPVFGNLIGPAVTGPGQLTFNATLPPTAGTYRIPIYAGVNMVAATFFLTVDPAAQATFTASGTALTLKGDPVPGATISFSLNGGSAPASLQTDAAGKWSQSGFSYGKSYTATAALAGYTFTPASLTITGASSGYNFKGTGPYAIAGAVTNAAGGPVAGVTLSFSRITAGAAPASVQTDAAGKWSQSGFDSGVSFSVTPSKTGCTFSPTALTVSSANGSLNFAASCPFAASGNIKTTSGVAVAGVTLVFTAAVGNPPASVVSDNAGNWTQSNFETGVAYTVSASKAGYILTPASLAFSSASTSLNFTADPPYTASGKVINQLGAPVAGVTITFTRASGSGATPTAVTTGADGRWSQSGFDAGAQFVATPSLTDATFAPATVTLTGATTAANFTATIRFRVSGKVTLKSGAPLPGVTLTFSTATGGGSAPGVVTTAADGTWVQTGFDPGTSYRVTPSLNNYAFNPSSTVFSNATAALNFTAIQRFSVSGKVVDDTGKPLARVSIGFIRVAGSGPLPNATQTGADGAWTQTGFEDSSQYQAIPVLDGYTFLPESWSFQAANNALDFTGAAGYAVAGQVTDKNGQALAGVTIAFAKNAGNGKVPKDVITGPDGKFRQVGFELRTNYRAMASKAGSNFVPPLHNFNQPAADLNFRER